MIQSQQAPNKFRGRMEKLKGLLVSESILPPVDEIPLRQTQTPLRIKQNNGSLSDDDDDNNQIEISGRQIGVNGRSFNDEYVIGNKLGEGTNGVVYMCWKKDQPQMPLAVKQLQNRDEEMLKIIKASFMNTLLLKSPYIARCYKLFVEPNVIYMVMEYVPYGNLEEILKERGKLNEHQTQQIASQLLKAVRILHNAGICHRDIKPDNIQINPENFDIKLVDFGVSRRYVTLNQANQRYIRSKMLTQTGSVCYRAPEIHSQFGYGYDHQIDIWAVGIVVYQCLTGMLPIWFETTAELISVLSSKEPYKEHFHRQEFVKLSSSSRDFLRRVLMWNPLQRLSASESLKHIWIPNFQTPGRCVLKQKTKDDIEMSKVSQGSDLQINRNLINSAMMLTQELQNTLIQSRIIDTIQEIEEETPGQKNPKYLNVSVELNNKHIMSDFRQRLQQFKLEASTKIYTTRNWSQKHVIELIDTITHVEDHFITKQKATMTTSIEHESTEGVKADLFDMQFCDSLPSLTQIEEDVQKEETSESVAHSFDPALLLKLKQFDL